MKTKTVTSSGGVIFKIVGGIIEVALIARSGKPCHTKTYSDASRGGKPESGKCRTGERIWGLPKGLVEPGEMFEEAAVREVQEETGLTAEIIGKIDRIDYWFYWKPEDTRYHKYVHFYLMKHTGGDESRHDWEVEEVRWFTIEEALAMLTYTSEKGIMQEAIAMIQKLPQE